LLSFFFQELEQEKYLLRRRLETAQEEYEQKVAELQQDVSTLQAQLSDHASVQRQTEKEKSLLITTLTEQNQRLTTQLKEVSFINIDLITLITYSFMSVFSENYDLKYSNNL